jgi:transcriptional regulator with XRE-family HTH domain
MDVAQFARDRLRLAREQAKLSQREMAKLLGLAQATVSDIERGRVQITVAQLADFAERLGKPLSYFLPADASGGDAVEAEVLDALRTLPAEWRTWVLNDVRRYAKLHDVVQPYIRAGVPEEFYDILIVEENQILEVWESVPDEAPTKADFDAYDERYLRYREWRDRLDATLKDKQA